MSEMKSSTDMDEVIRVAKKEGACGIKGPNGSISAVVSFPGKTTVEELNEVMRDMNRIQNSLINDLTETVAGLDAELTAARRVVEAIPKPSQIRLTYFTKEVTEVIIPIADWLKLKDAISAYDAAVKGKK